MCGFFLVRGRRPDDDQGVQVAAGDPVRQWLRSVDGGIIDLGFLGVNNFRKYFGRKSSSSVFP